MEYLLIELVLFVAAFAFQKHYKIRLFKNFRQLLIFWIPVIFLGSIWDNFAVYRGDWLYTGTGIIGLWIFLIPIEDYIFMIVVTYAILVTYHVSKVLIFRTAHK